MNDDDFRKLIDALQKEFDRQESRDYIPFIRISNDYYAKDSALDTRLSGADKQMLLDMGILGD